MITIPSEVWDLLKIGIGAYFVFCLNKTDRNQRELFNRLRQVEIVCAGHHGLSSVKGGNDEDT